MNYNEFFTRDANRVGSEVVFAGTRVTLRTILASLAEGDTKQELLRSFPSLTVEQIRAAQRLASDDSVQA